MPIDEHETTIPTLPKVPDYVAGPSCNVVPSGSVIFQRSGDTIIPMIAQPPYRYASVNNENDQASVNHILRDMGRKTFFEMHPLIETPSTTCRGNPQRSAIRGFLDTRECHLWSFCSLKYLKFTCAWKIDNDGFETPKFLANSERHDAAVIDAQAVNPGYVWAVPAGHDLILLFNHATKQPHLYIYVQEQKEVFMLPIPNQYEDGSLCLGEYHNAIEGLSFEETAEYMANLFMSSIWNKDLFSEAKTKPCAQLFRWKEGSYQVPADGSYTNKYIRIGLLPILESFFTFVNERKLHL